MLKKASSKVLLITIMLSITLVFGISTNVSAKDPEPPLGTERLTGPAIIGTVILDGQNLSFTGSCKGNKVSLSAYFPITLSLLKEEHLNDYRIGSIKELGAGNCYSTVSAGGDLIVNTVTDFSNDGKIATIDVVILGVVAR